ncbi:MAG: MATE family efflux transporter [Spirochaetales bacterium]|nr:MATE family efflux transporter [Candidatus Physcosoma equi]
MAKHVDFTKGNIASSLISFALPVFLAMLLQSLYGAVDLFIIGRFGSSAGVSAVSTGTQAMWAVTVLVTGLASGVTVLAGNRLGQKKNEEAGRIIAESIVFFLFISVVATVLMEVAVPLLVRVLHVPEEALPETIGYLRICGGGLLAITAYNLIGSIFRGIGDSKVPLLTVAMAAGVNVIGDLVLVRVFHLGAYGAAIATVFAQLFSVVVSLLIIRHRTLPFVFKKEDIRLNWNTNRQIFRVGFPIGLQDMLISFSFLFLLTIVNSRGLVDSAGMGIAERVCGFMMLLPSAFSQSLSVFVAQNNGAGKLDRAQKGLGIGIAMSFLISLVVFYGTFFHGDFFCGLFTSDQTVADAGWSWLKAYAIDSMLTAFHFCYSGYFSGREKTIFVMMQGTLSSFLVRIPVAYLMSRIPGSTLFQIGWGIPISSLTQIVVCTIYFLFLTRRDKENGKANLPV